MATTDKIKRESFISLSPNKISYGFQAMFKIEEDGIYSWYIPSFDIYFSSPTKEAGDKRAKAMVRSFFNYWLKNQGYRNFLMQILKLGYKPSSHQELQSLLNRTNLTANLKSSAKVIPHEFADTEAHEENDSLAIAI
jgi:hypothetical protein